MNLKKNTRIIGMHAFLSPSKPYWLNYDEDKLTRVYWQKQQAKRGDELHAYAQRAIELRIKQADNGTTLSMYINDAIGFRMTPEVPLMWSTACFGTADAVGFGDNTLRIFDLKTGSTPADIMQPKVYAGLFCLEYNYEPKDIRMDLRIYQNDAVNEIETDPADILMVMSRIKTQSALIQYLSEED